MSYFHFSFWGFRDTPAAENAALAPRTEPATSQPFPQPREHQSARARTNRARAATDTHTRGRTTPMHTRNAASDTTETAGRPSDEGLAILRALDEDIGRDIEEHLRVVREHITFQNQRILDILEAALDERQDASLDRLRHSQARARQIVVEDIRRILPTAGAHRFPNRWASVSSDEDDMRHYRRQAHAARLAVNALGARAVGEEVQRADREGSVYRYLAEEVARDVAQAIQGIGRHAYEVCALLIRYPIQR